VDSGVEEGAEVPVQYDPMLAKLIAWGETRDAAIARASAALRDFPVLGVRTNIAFLIRILEHDAFLAGRVHTGFVDEHERDLLATPEPPPAVFAAAAAASVTTAQVAPASPSASTDPWTTLQGWGR
jgi:3-methylcrotonyl-CoA carboxylase alpha subunit